MGNQIDMNTILIDRRTVMEQSIGDDEITCLYLPVVKFDDNPKLEDRISLSEPIVPNWERIFEKHHVNKQKEHSVQFG